jgi:hypothetical protein
VDVLLHQAHGGARLVGHLAQHGNRALDDHRREPDAELVDHQQLR